MTKYRKDVFQDRHFGSLPEKIADVCEDFEDKTSSGAFPSRNISECLAMMR
ncbi:MAG: hypothetical protein HGA41_00965 [Syntrophaceae bacterium]|nr:hypothetical protein [Syntrophaceae bacterium]